MKPETKLLIFSFFYGVVVINWHDLYPGPVPGYHLLLTIFYFAPYIPLVLIDKHYFPHLIIFGLLTSLYNDLLYYVVGNLLFGTKIDLIEWWTWQLGFRGLDGRWAFDFLLFKTRVTSILMGISIYIRIIIILITYWKLVNRNV